MIHLSYRFFSPTIVEENRDYTRNENQTFFEGDNEMGYLFLP